MHHVSAGHFRLGCAAVDDVKQLFLLIEGLLHYRILCRTDKSTLAKLASRIHSPDRGHGARP